MINETQLYLDGDKFILDFSYSQENILNAKMIGGYFYNKNKQYWEYPATKEVYLTLKRIYGCQIEGVENYLNRKCIDIRKHDFVFPPFEHQKEALRFLFDQFGFSKMRREKPESAIKKPISIGTALFMDMGTGKTKTIIDATDILHSVKEVKNIFVLCPLSLVDTWARVDPGNPGEIKKHSKTALPNPIDGNGKPKRIKQLDSIKQKIKEHKGAVFNIIGIESINSLEKKLKEILIENPPDLCIIDESTIIKNASADRSTKVGRLFGLTKYKIIATGNPIPKGPGDIFGQYKFADVGIFGKNEYSFKERFFHLDHFKNTKGWKRREEYEEKFHRISFTRRKDECLDLPPKIYKTVEVEFSPEQKEAYIKMKKEAVLVYNDLSISADIVMTKLMRMSQISGGFLPLQNELGETVEYKAFDPNPKIDALVETINQIPGDEQIVIWSCFTQEIKSISKRLSKAGILNAVYDGTRNYAQKNEAKRAFREKEIRCFIGNPAAGGKGLNDLIEGTVVIYYSNDAKTENRQQSEDRNHRNGTIKVLYIDIIVKAKGLFSIDERMLGILKDDKDVSDAILNRDSSFFA